MDGRKGWKRATRWRNRKGLRSQGNAKKVYARTYSKRSYWATDNKMQEWLATGRSGRCLSAVARACDPFHGAVLFGEVCIQTAKRMTTTVGLARAPSTTTIVETATQANHNLERNTVPLCKRIW